MIHRLCLSSISIVGCWIYLLFINLYKCLTTTFLHIPHSLMAKLGRWGWLMRMRLAWKKSQKTLHKSTRIYWNKTGSTGSAGKWLDSQLCHYWKLRTGASRLKASRGGGGGGAGETSSRWRLQPGLSSPPPEQRRQCIKLLNLNLFATMIECTKHTTQGMYWEQLYYVYPRWMHKLRWS